VSERVLVWLLLERDGAVLMALRKAEAPPFGGQLVLPGDEMDADESAAETIGRVAREELGIAVTGEQFVETIYLEEQGVSYATNVFRLTSFEGRPRFRESGPYADVRWGYRSELNDPALSLPQPLRELLTKGNDDASLDR
jgi:ADP-ribose pyrophosphatase YjhB (NUDIX family)